MSDADFLWKLIIVLNSVSSLVIAWLKIKGGQSVRIDGQPLQMQQADHYITEDDLGQVIDRIDRLEKGQGEYQKQVENNLQEIFRELRSIARSIGRIEGKQLSDH